MLLLVQPTKKLPVVLLQKNSNGRKQKVAEIMQERNLEKLELVQKMSPVEFIQRRVSYVLTFLVAQHLPSPTVVRVLAATLKLEPQIEQATDAWVSSNALKKKIETSTTPSLRRN
jgi:hypothetical protein